MPLRQLLFSVKTEEHPPCAIPRSGEIRALIGRPERTPSEITFLPFFRKKEANHIFQKKQSKEHLRGRASALDVFLIPIGYHYQEKNVPKGAGENLEKKKSARAIPPAITTTTTYQTCLMLTTLTAATGSLLTPVTAPGSIIVGIACILNIFSSLNICGGTFSKSATKTTKQATLAITKTAT